MKPSYWNIPIIFWMCRRRWNLYPLERELLTHPATTDSTKKTRRTKKIGNPMKTP